MFINKLNFNKIEFRGIYDPNILVTGSSGYIGSHLIPKLADEGYNCVICCRNKAKQDYLENAIEQVNKSKVDKSSYTFTNLDLSDETSVKNVLNKNKSIDAVIHLGGSTYNSESIVNPRKYYNNNVFASRNLINSMLDNKIRNLLYLSTASVYAKYFPGKVTESRTPSPKTPYAKTKFMSEQLINDYKVYDLNSIVLRLFNAAGAHGLKDLDIGNNVITFLLKVIHNNGLFTLMGDNYKTPDGTCIKDFIHVDDVTNAISKALAKLLDNNCGVTTYNLGTGIGTSLRELIDKSTNITGKDLMIRLGDTLKDEVPSLVANNKKIVRELGWTPQKTVDDIITSSWKWILQNGGKR